MPMEEKLIQAAIDNFVLGHIQIFIIADYLEKTKILISNENNKVLPISNEIVQEKLRDYLLGLASYIESISKLIRFIDYSSLLHKYKNIVYFLVP